MTSEEPRPEPAPPRPSVGARLLAWLRRPSSWGELAGVAAVVLGAGVLFLVVVGGPPKQHVAGASIAPGMARRLMALRPRVAIKARLDLAGDRPFDAAIREEGAAVGLSFLIEERARALVIEDRAGIYLVQLHPIAGRPADPIPAGQRVEVTNSRGGPLVVTEPRGSRRVRLIVFPEDIDPLTLHPTELDRVQGRLTVIERTYRAARRGEATPDPTARRRITPQ
jgi:hypothetical protein